MFERIVAMNVTDPVGYQAYREAMTPILTQYGGGFRFDFAVSESFTEVPGHPVTRLFAIGFPDEATSERFFSDPAYLAVKTAHYTAAVDGHTVLVAHTVD